MNIKKISFSVGAVLLIAGFTLAEKTASAATSWNNQPTWAQGQSNDPAPTTNHRSYPAKESYAKSNVSPFSPGSNNVSLDVGQVFLMGDLSDTYTNAIGTQIHYTYGVSDVFGFDSSFGYSSHSSQTNPTGNFSVTSLLAGMRSNLTWYDKVIPHFILGLGFYKPTMEVSPTQSVSPVMFGLHMGPGIDLELTKQVFFGASLTFHDMFGATATKPGGGTVDVTGSYTSFFLRAGVTFN